MAHREPRGRLAPVAACSSGSIERPVFKHRAGDGSSAAFNHQIAAIRGLRALGLTRDGIAQRRWYRKASELSKHTAVASPPLRGERRGAVSPRRCRFCDATPR
jgi:hypothetical protein